MYYYYYFSVTDYIKNYFDCKSVLLSQFTLVYSKTFIALACICTYLQLWGPLNSKQVHVLIYETQGVTTFSQKRKQCSQ